MASTGTNEPTLMRGSYPSVSKNGRVIKIDNETTRLVDVTLRDNTWGFYYVKILSKLCENGGLEINSDYYLIGASIIIGDSKSYEVVIDPYPYPHIVVTEPEAEYLKHLQIVTVDGVEIPDFTHYTPNSETESIYVVGNEKTDYILHVKNWLDSRAGASLYMFSVLCSPWITNTYNMYGKGTFVSPRLMHHMGDEGVSHDYGGRSNDLLPWQKPCLLLRGILEKLYPEDLNGMLVNYYRNGKDSIADHSDKEAMGKFAVVIGLSLGGERDFRIRHKETNEIRNVRVNHGDLFIMSGSYIQEAYLHGIPKRANMNAPRISYTFRNLGNN